MLSILLKFLFIILLFVTLFLVLGYGYIKGKIVIKNNKAEYAGYHVSTDRDNFRRFNDSSIDIQYEISDIKMVKESFNNIIVYGNIKYLYDRKNSGQESVLYQSKLKKLDLKKIKILKQFKNNKQLIKQLKEMVKEDTY